MDEEVLDELEQMAGRGWKSKNNGGIESGGKDKWSLEGIPWNGMEEWIMEWKMEWKGQWIDPTATDQTT